MEKRTKEGLRKKREYTDRFNKENMYHVAFRFSKTKDDDIREHLNKQKNKAQYIKNLIRKDIKDNQ